jgi:hypothetical protein
MPVLITCETWTLNSRMLHKIQCTQRSMERCMLGITRRDRKRNTWVRSMTDIAEGVKNLKWTQREEWMPDGREKYWNGIREDVKESKVDRVNDGLMNWEECVESTGCRLLKTDRNERGSERSSSSSGWWTAENGDDDIVIAITAFTFHWVRRDINFRLIRTLCKF